MENDRRFTDTEINREEGKRLIFSPESSREEKAQGIRMLYAACRSGDPEARYLIGKMLLEGTISLKAGDSVQGGVDLLCSAANREYYPARALLAKYCMDKYRRAFPAGQENRHPLTGFDGRRIVIDHKGRLVPVDALLEYTPEGKNVLTFSLDLLILDEGAETADNRKLRDTIISGIRMWEGDYTVFGGQQLQVKINITEETKLFDHVVIALMAGTMLDMMNRTADILHTKKAREMKEIIRSKRSMATMGHKKWTVRSRRYIYLHSETGLFDDYDEIRHVVKHEFGHVLGLGDLYEEAEAGLPGVPAGRYAELDSFLLGDRFYNLVMCSHRGLISNNDMEMVVLAFSENRSQQYQPTKYTDTISKALGRGN